MVTVNSGTQTSGDNEIVITRLFDAPRDLVWRAWTEADSMKQWSAPPGFTIPMNEGELRPGGAWMSCMRKPDGTELKLRGVYREIGEPERLVFTHAWDDDGGDPGPETVVTVVLTESEGKTDMEFRQSGFESAESRDGHADGWSQCFDRLEEVLSDDRKSSSRK